MIASDSVVRRRHFGALLEQSGMGVLGASALDAEEIRRAGLERADFVLFDLDEASGEKIGPLIDLVESCSVPVLFNDSSGSPPAQAGPELGKKIVLKLTPLSLGTAQHAWRRRR